MAQVGDNSYIKNLLNDNNGDQSVSENSESTEEMTNQDATDDRSLHENSSSHKSTSKMKKGGYFQNKTYEEQQDNYRRKKFYLDGLHRLKLQGDYTFYTNLNITSPLDELQYEYEKAYDNSKKKSYVQNARQYLYYTALGVETLNENYNKIYKLQLNGFSQTINNHSFEYDNDFEQLYEKYGSLESYLPPELSIIGKFAISLIMTHWTNNVIKGTNKNADPTKVYEDNPGLKTQVEQGIANSMRQGFQNSTGLESLVSNVMDQSYKQSQYGENKTNNNNNNNQSLLKGPRDDMRDIMDEISQEQNQNNPFDKKASKFPNDLETIENESQSALDEVSSINSLESPQKTTKKKRRGRPKKTN